jgi:magnesium chelatase subunit D
MLLAAVAASIPADLLSQLRLAQSRPSRSRSAGKAGQAQRAGQHGRPIGTRRGEPGGGKRLNVLETLKVAAPWQPVRAREPGAKPGRLAIRKDDFRTTVYRQKRGTTTIFVVDASGSAALQRLAETKGAVELLLADCYVRRDKVALIAFRGTAADLLLPPTNALARAKRSLAGLPGGGGTPLASGLEAALTLAETVTRSGQTVIVTVLTDGKANIGRDGKPGRPQAEADAMAAAGLIRAANITCLLVDTSPRPNPAAKLLAAAMGGRYLPLPYVDAAVLSQAVRVTASQAQSAQAQFGAGPRKPGP